MGVRAFIYCLFPSWVLAAPKASGFVSYLDSHLGHHQSTAKYTVEKEIGLIVY